MILLVADDSLLNFHYSKTGFFMANQTFIENQCNLMFTSDSRLGKFHDNGSPIFDTNEYLNFKLKGTDSNSGHSGTPDKR